MFRAIWVTLILAIAVTTADAVEVFSQPHDGGATLYQSSFWWPEDSDWDQHVWDDFTLSASQAITEIHWRGGYIYNGQYSPAIAEFVVAIYPTNITGFEPDVVAGPLVEYQTGNNCFQTSAGTFGGKAMYDYRFTLPSPFQASAGVKYWVCILAGQSYVPEWGIAKGTGGNGSHFRWLRGGHMYQFISGDTAFSLIGSTAPTHLITASVAPPAAGSVQGAGQYPHNSDATLVATPNSGWGFQNWTENNIPVSNNDNYTFTVTADRALVANFVPAYTITTMSMPSYGGTTAGGGVYNSGQNVTLTATPSFGFEFTSWTVNGQPVSTSANYSFPATTNQTYAANFATLPNTVLFTFDDGPIHTSLPIDLTAGGLSAHFSATGGGYSIQRADTLGFTPVGFSGLCIYPNSVFPADLVVDFSQQCTDFSILYSPQELGCDDSATMRVTVYMNDTFIATQTTTSPNHGNWPTHTLSISAPAGFNRAVVHYDARPPTCQDWGPIFLADNMTATIAGSIRPGDFNHDGIVNVTDLFNLLAAWGACPDCPTACPQDIAGGDCIVNVNDLFMLLANWG